MSTFAPERFERQAEAFACARAARQLPYLAGQAAGLGFEKLYEIDFPSFTSIGLWGDLHEAPMENARLRQRLLGFLAAAHTEGRAWELAERAAAVALLPLPSEEDSSTLWRAAQTRWTLEPSTPRRHAIEEAWRHASAADLNPALQRLQERLLASFAPLTPEPWLAFWGAARGVDPAAGARLAESLSARGDETYARVLGVYLARFDLPVDDVWQADADWSFRAPQFDAAFPAKTLMRTIAGTFQALGLDVATQTGLRLDASYRLLKAPGTHVVPLDVPRETAVLIQPIGGWQDYAGTLRAVGSALPWQHVDPSLPFASRWLGDAGPALASGLLFESLTRDPDWLRERVDLEDIRDYQVIVHLAWAFRVRRLAALVLHEQAVWADESTRGGLAADYAERLSLATHVRHFPETYLEPLVGAPWSALAAAESLQAEVFAAQLRRYLRKEFDTEWWRDRRAGRFLVDDLWRPGGRYGTADLLGFMGYEGFDMDLLWQEVEEVLSTV